MKKTTGEILQSNEVFEKSPQKVKNFGIWIVYSSRSGTHNLYKEFRDTTRVGAVSQMYMDMASRHRARFRSIQIREVLELPASKCKRPNITQFHVGVFFVSVVVDVWCVLLCLCGVCVCVCV
jgi:large subunit ribosomal protein L18Ae